MEISLTVAEKLVCNENEECAKIADSFAIRGLQFKNPGEIARAIADAIRERVKSPE